MSAPAPATQDTSATKPHQKLKGHTEAVMDILRLPSGQRIITCSWDGSLRIWDLESGTQVGEEWRDEGSGRMHTIALSPDGKTVASGSEDGAVRMWDIGTGKVIKKWTGHTQKVISVCWSPDGRRVVSQSEEGSVRVWEVESGKTILGPIKTMEGAIQPTDWTPCGSAVCYSPDGTMIATGSGVWVRVWNANTGELLKTLDEGVWCLAWTSDGKTLISGGYNGIWKFDTATWTATEITVVDQWPRLEDISLSPNERILASVTKLYRRVQLWSLTNNQPIRLPLHHDNQVNCAAFSADGKFLATGCVGGDIYTWDVSAIVREAGLENLLSDNLPAASSSQPPNTHTTQTHSGETQSAPSSSQQPLPAATATASTPSVAAGTAGAAGVISRPHITIRDAGWRARFMVWVCCIPSVQHTDGQH